MRRKALTTRNNYCFKSRLSIVNIYAQILSLGRLPGSPRWAPQKTNSLICKTHVSVIVRVVTLTALRRSQFYYFRCDILCFPVVCVEFQLIFLVNWNFMGKRWFWERSEQNRYEKSKADEVIWPRVRGWSEEGRQMAGKRSVIERHAETLWQNIIIPYWLWLTDMKGRTDRARSFRLSILICFRAIFKINKFISFPFS